LVDGDEQYPHALKHNLEDADEMNKVHIFRTGEDCLESLFKSTPDALILDYYLNDMEPASMTKIYALTKMREIEKGIPIIILSIQKDLDIPVNCTKSEAVDCIAKNKESAFRLKQDLIHLLSAKAVTEK
jgi:DNA-binding NtrC family response regulator